MWPDRSTWPHHRHRPSSRAFSIPAALTGQRGWNTGHLHSSITGKGPVFPTRLPPPHTKTEWRRKHRQIRGNSPKTLLRRFGCRVKMAFPRNTFLKERVRMRERHKALLTLLVALCRTLSYLCWLVVMFEFTSTQSDTLVIQASVSDVTCLHLFRCANVS